LFRSTRPGNNAIVSSTPVSSAEGPVTLREVARRAGVSTATVARVLQGGTRVAPETAARVNHVLTDSGYRVNAVAQGLSRGTTRTIGHLLHVAGVNPFYSWVALGLQRRAAEYGYEVILYNSHADAASEAAGVDVFLSRRVDAIVFTTALDPKNVETAAAAVPVVQVERPTPFPTATVTVDNGRGATEATRHLIELGHRDIVFMGAPAVHEDWPSRGAVEQQRINGYLRAMRSAGLPPRIKTHDRGGAQYTEELGRELARKVLAHEAIPTAIFAGSDLFAAGVLQALHEARLRVPDDISVVGFDDTDAAKLTPPLTTVALPMIDIGREALQLALLNNRNVHRRLRSTLVTRASTSKPPAASRRRRA
jgi:DNA-binding LacI/PurR family transcriptional regulator